MLKLNNTIMSNDDKKGDHNTGVSDDTKTFFNEKKVLYQKKISYLKTLLRI